MKTILKAPAKVNICLKVNAKNKDGYHDLINIMQSIRLYDILEVEIIKPKKGMVYEKDEQINLKCNFSYIPTDGKNLIVKITRYIFDKHNIKDKINIDLKKMIPTGAGLGGGSSDAASILLFLNRYYMLMYSLKSLSEIAKQFGADIPYFLYRKECMCRGIGDLVTPVYPFKGYYVLIATPDVRVSTKDIYEKYDNVPYDEKRDAINDNKVKNILFSLERNDIEILAANIFNDLELVTAREIEVIDILKEQMISLGAVASMMSGSGPTVFGLFRDLITAKKCKDILKERHPSAFVFVAKPV